MTPHNKGNKGDFAKTVLLPGDPVRAKYVAENFLENARKITDVRNVLGYTGTYKGIEVSVMSCGMGAPSAGIYTYELFTEYDVDNILRIGTSGGLQADIPVGCLVLSMACSTDSNYASQYRLEGNLAPVADYGLLSTAVECVKELGYDYRCGMTFSSDYFSTYTAAGNEHYEKFAKMGALATDMETIALYCNAMYTHKKALSILTMTDNCVTGESFKDEERMQGNDKMIRLALETAVKLAEK